MKMLICTDGSSQAENAIHFGGLIAGAARAETTLLGITEDPLDKEKIFDSLKRGQESLKTLNVDAEIVSKAGEPIEEIVKRTQRAEYDLVVIGAVRKGIRGPFAMSAKAYRIIRAVKPPVLVVMGRREALKRILICTGASRYINKAIRFTCEIAKATGASITLFHVVAEPPAVYADLIRMEENVIFC